MDTYWEEERARKREGNTCLRESKGEREQDIDLLAKRRPSTKGELWTTKPMIFHANFDDYIGDEDDDSDKQGDRVTEGRECDR